MKKLLLILLCLPLVYSCGDKEKIKKLEDRITYLEKKNENIKDGSFNTAEVMEALSIDGVQIKLDLSFRYKPISLVDEIGQDHLERIIIAEIRSITSEVIGNYEVRELYSKGIKLIEEQISARVKYLLKKNQVILLDTIVIENLWFHPRFTPDKIDIVIVEEFTIKAVGNTMQEMAFDTKELEVKAGSTVKITLVNEGTDPSIIHNIVFVKRGTRKEVALESVAAGPDNGFVAKGNSNVIAYSPMAQPGETVSFEFTAPKKGSYEYLCTYPGHSDMMKGWLYVE